MKITTKTLCFLSVFYCVIPLNVAWASNWAVQLESENEFDDDGKLDSAVETTVMFRNKNESLKMHLEYNKPVSSPDRDGNVEWQIDKRWKPGRMEYAIRHELDRDFDDDETKNELTLRGYYQLNDSLEIGFDLEIDYFDSGAESKFRLFEVEIEPTIIWTKKFGRNKFIAELEAPVTRLVSDKPGRQDLQVEGAKVIIRYQRKLSSEVSFNSEFRFNYDRISSEFEQEARLSTLR